MRRGCPREYKQSDGCVSILASGLDLHPGFGQVETGVFFGLDKPKLVSYCRDDDIYEQYVLQEYQLYRIYRMLTPNSYRARLVEMTYTDSASGKVEAKRAAILLEELASEKRWADLFAKSQAPLARLAEEALAEHRAGKTKPF